MKALYLGELYNVPARMEDIPLYVKKEDKKGNIHIYVKVNATCEPVPYKGRFGIGYTVKLHNDNSTRYALKAYYTELSHGAVYSENGYCIFD